MMQEVGVPAGALQDAEDLQEYHPQLKHRHLYFRLEHREVGEYTAPRPVFMLSKCPATETLSSQSCHPR